MLFFFFFFFFFFNDTATTEIYTLSLHDALPICAADAAVGDRDRHPAGLRMRRRRPLLHANVVPPVIDGGKHRASLRPPRRPSDREPGPRPAPDPAASPPCRPERRSERGAQSGEHSPDLRSSGNGPGAHSDKP